MAIGHLDNDNFPDLAVANYFGNTVSVLSGNGTGAFLTKVDYVADKPGAVAIARLGTDAAPDLVFANEGSDSVSVLLNNSASGPGVFRHGFESAAVVAEQDAR